MTTEPGSGPPISNPQEPNRPEPGGTAGESSSELLQSMLARAAEEQLGEQRELASAMGDIRTQLMRMSQEIAELRVRPRDESVDAQINHVTVEMREAVRFLSERLDGVTRMVAQRGEDLADIRTAVTAVDTHVRSQAETIGVLSAGLQALPSYGERVSVLQDNVQAVHQQLTGIDEKLSMADGEDRYAERLASIESSVAPLAQRLEADSEIASAQSALLSQLQTSASQLQQAVERLNNRLDPIASDLTAIGGHVAGLVEGSATGAALDSRVSESVSEAVRTTERRLTEHVDEAVLALAQTLLKHRVVSTAPSEPLSSTTATASGSAPADIQSTSSATETPEDLPPSADLPTSVWRKGDDLSTDGSDSGDAADSDDDTFAAAGWGGRDDEAPVAVEAPARDEFLDSVFQPDAEPVDAAETDNPLMDDGDDDEVSLPSLAAMASEAEETGPTATDTDDSAETAEESDATELWAPETPPARSDGDDPTGPLPGKRKRRWGRH